MDAMGRQATEVRKIFGDLPIVEAKTDFIVYVTADEQMKSVRGDPQNCMFSNACKRAFGSKGVLFFPTVAYVDMVDPADASRRIVMRFRLTGETRERLEAFDRGEGGVREATFLLKSVPKSQTLEHHRVKGRNRMRLLRQGVTKPSEKRRAAAQKGHATRRNKLLMGVRDGHGQVHTRESEESVAP